MSLFAVTYSLQMLALYQVINPQLAILFTFIFSVGFILRCRFLPVCSLALLFFASYYQKIELDDCLDNSRDWLTEHNVASSRGRYSTVVLDATVDKIIDSSVVHGRRLLLQPIEFVGGGKILVTVTDLPWDEIATVNTGARISLKLKLTILPRTHKSRSSYEQYLYRQKIVGYGYLEELQRIESYGADSLKQQAVISLLNKFEKDEGLAILIASTLGDRSLLGVEISQTFKDLGLMHLLVVSGFHVGLVFLLFRKLFRYLLSLSLLITSYFSADRVAAISALLFSWGYVVTIDAGLSSERAIVMLAIYTIGLILGRKASKLNVLLLSFIAINLLWPAALLDIGCQLTYAALFGLLSANLLLSSRDLNRSFATKILSAYIFSLFAWAFTSPLLLYWFGVVPIVGPIMNLLVVTIFTISVIGSGLIGGALSAIDLPYIFELADLAADGLCLLLWRIDTILAGISWLFITPDSSSITTLPAVFTLFAPLFLVPRITSAKEVID